MIPRLPDFVLGGLVMAILSATAILFSFPDLPYAWAWKWAVLVAAVLLFFFGGLFRKNRQTLQSQEGDGASGEQAEKEAEDETFWTKLTRDPISLFTAILALATILLFGISVVQLGFLNRAEHLSKIAAYAAKDASEASAQQAYALRGNIELEIFIHPVGKDDLYLDREGAPDEMPVAYDVNPSFKNIGGTNVVNYQGWFNIFFATKPSPFANLDERLSVDCPFSIAPGQNIPKNVITPGSRITMFAQRLKADVVAAAAAANTNIEILIAGYGGYNDIFPKSPLHHYDWCVIAAPNDIKKGKFSFINKRLTID